MQQIVPRSLVNNGFVWRTVKAGRGRIPSVRSRRHWKPTSMRYIPGRMEPEQMRPQRAVDQTSPSPPCPAPAELKSPLGDALPAIQSRVYDTLRRKERVVQMVEDRGRMVFLTLLDPTSGAVERQPFSRDTLAVRFQPVGGGAGFLHKDRGPDTADCGSRPSPPRLSL